MAPKRILILAAILAGLVTVLIFSFFGAHVDEGDYLTHEERAFLERHGPVRFVSQTNYPPFEYLSDERGMEGMCIELARWMSTELGFRVIFDYMTFEEAQHAVRDGRAEVLTSLFFSEKRQEIFDFTNPMFEVPALIFVRAERPDIKEIKDLNGKKVAMQRGDYAAEYLSSKGIDCQIVPTADFAQATDLVIAGKADAVIGDEQIVFHHLYDNNLTQHVKSVGKPLYVGKNCMGLKKGSPLAPIIRKGIIQAARRGVINNLNAKWLGRKYLTGDPWYRRYAMELAIAVAALFAGAAMAVFWNVRLRKLVNDRTADLKLSEEKYRSLADDALDTSDVCMVVVGPDGLVVWANSALKSIFGIDPKKAVGRSLDAVFDGAFEKTRPGLSELLLAMKEPLGKEGAAGAKEYCVETAHGEPKWVSHWSGQISVGLYRGGRIEHLTDVTERKNRLNEISREKELWEKTINAVPEYIAIIDGEYRIVRANRAMLERLNLPDGEVLGRTCYACVHMTGEPSELCPHAKLLADGREHSVEIFEERLGGTMQVTVTPLYDENGGLLGSVHVARDLTEQKNAERILMGQRDLSIAIGASKDPEEALGMALDAALLIDGVDAGGAYVVDENTGEVTIVTHRGLGEEILGHISRIESGSPQARLTAKGLPYYYPFRELAVATGMKVPKKKFKASVLLPLVHEGKAVAALNLFSGFLPEFGNETKHYLESIAIQIAGIISRKKSSQKLRESQLSLNSLFEHMEDMLFVLDDHGRVMHTNRIVQEKLGYAPEELAGMDALCLHPEHIAEEAGRVHDAILTAGRGYCPYPLITRNGSTIPSETVYSRGEWDGKKAFFGVARDRSEALAAEREIRKELAFRKAVIESALEGVCVCHEMPEFPFVRFTVWNSKMEELVGYTMEEINRLGWYQTVYPDENLRKTAIERMERMREGEDIMGEDWPITAKDGSVKIVRIMTSLLDYGGEHRSVLAMMTDVTEAKRTENIIRESEEFFRAVAAGNPVPMAVSDDQGKSIFINQRFVDTFGYSQEELPSINEWWPLAYPDNEVRRKTKLMWREIVKSAMEGGETEPRESLVKCKDGTMKLMEFRYAHAAGRGIVIATDLTERKKAENELRRYARVQEVLLREVNHRVKNNLTAIISMLHMEEDRSTLRGEEVGFATLHSIEGRVRCLLSVHTLLSAAQWQPLPITDLVGEVLDSTVRVFSPAARPSLKIGPSALKIDSDHAHSLTIILNELATNSMKYAKPAEGPVKIEVSMETEEEKAILTYRDNGQGYPESVLSSVRPEGSIGFTLMEGIAGTSLGGEIRFMNDLGAKAVLVFPLDGETDYESGEAS